MEQVIFPRPKSANNLVEWGERLTQALTRFQELNAAKVLPGTMVAQATVVAPSGWLLANGSIVAQNDYPLLYSKIGNAFNTGGEGAGNFRLPNWAAPGTGGSWIVKI